MATADQYAQWIVDNAAKKGTPEFDTVAKAYQEVVAEERSLPPVEVYANEGMPAERTVSGFLGNVGPSGAKVVGGLVQAVAHPIDTVKGVLDLGAGTLQNALPKALVDFVNKSETPEALAAGKKAVEVANAVGGEYKQKYGSIEALTNTLYTDPVGAVADLSLLFTGGGGALRAGANVAEKAGVSAAALNAPRAVAGALQKGGAAIDPTRPVVYGASLPFRLAAKGTGAVRNMLAPKETALIAAAEGRGQDIVNALRNYDDMVAGVRPTAGTVVAGQMPATKYAALQQELAERLSTPYYERNQANVAARGEALGTIAQDEAALKAAEAARKTATTPLYGTADKQIIKADDTLNTLLERPSMEKALARAKTLAEERNETFQMGKNAPEQKVGSTIVDVDGNPLDVKTIPAEYVKFNGKSLHYLKLALDDLIKDPKSFGLGSNEIGAIKNTRTEFLNWFENKSDSYKAARETYAAMSKPVNIMQVGQFLEGKLKPAVETTVGERAGVFSAAVKEAPTTLKRSTGQTRLDSLDQILEPEQVKIVENIRKDLAREAEFAKQATEGGKSGRTLPASAPARIPDFMSRVVTVANTILTKLQGKINEKLAIEMATEMLDPKAAATAMEKALAREAKGQNLADPFKKTGAAVYAGARSPLTLGGVQINNALVQGNQNNLRND
jgi:hypothetical protein